MLHLAKIGSVTQGGSTPYRSMRHPPLGTIQLQAAGRYEPDLNFSKLFQDEIPHVEASAGFALGPLSPGSVRKDRLDAGEVLPFEGFASGRRGSEKLGS
jgi:hypothetical protein